MTTGDKKTIFRFLGLLKKYRGKIVFLMLALLCSIFLSLFSPILSRKLMDDGLMKRDFKVILKMILILFAFRQISILLSLWIERKRLGIVYDFRFHLEKQAIDHILAIKADYFHKVGQSELLSQIDVDVNYICSILNTNTLSIISSIFTIVGGIGAAVYMDFRLSLLFFSMLPFKYLIIHIHSKFQKKKLNLFLEKNIAYARWFSEVVTGMTDIRIFGLERKKQEEFVKMDGEKIAAHRDMDALSQYRSLADGTLDALLNLLIFLIGGIFIVRGELTVGSLYAFLSYSSYVMAPLSSILNLKFILTNVLPSATRFFEFLDQTEEDTMEGEQEIKFPLAEEVLQKKNFPGENSLDIEFRHVLFCYNAEEKEKKVLNGVDLNIPEGEKLALIGRNGSGKTTLIKLLLRFYSCQDGSILLDGHEIEKIPLKEYRGLFSVVSQEIYLFNDTIRNNICMYRDFAEDAIRAVLDEVGLSELIAERGMDFPVGINGAFLSGGQKQKVALARALLYDRPVFLFDEATSNTDIDFEARFRKMLTQRLANKTVIMITHNVDLLQVADHIVLMGEGEILCGGSYEDLKGGDERFAKWLEQNENGET